MNLKEAYHYQNFLDKLITDAELLLSERSYITTTVQTHKIKEAANSGEDKTNIMPKPIEINVEPKVVIDLVVKFLEEKKKLSDAIVNAKKSAEIDIDSSIAINKKYHDFISVLNRMVNIKAQEKETNGIGYRLNPTSGSQEKFTYTIIEKTTIDYPRDDVRGLIKKYNKLADEVSARLDLIELTTEVNYTPIWDVIDTFENIVEDVVA